MVAVLIAAQLSTSSIEWDAHAYWLAWHNHLYSAAPEQRDAYLYSPAFAQLIWPATLLPWAVFATLWAAGVAGAYWWLLRPLALQWRLPIFGLCCLDIAAGNVWSLFAITLVLGFRRPALWAIPLLTKLTPVLGPAWFAARREWRKLGIWFGTVFIIVAVSVSVRPDLWHAWFNLLLHPESHRAATGGDWQPLLYLHGPWLLAFELPIAVAITVYAARTSRPWLLAIAMVLANPVLTSDGLVVLAALPRLLDHRAWAERSTSEVEPPLNMDTHLVGAPGWPAPFGAPTSPNQP
jgi:hypothetical protein